MAVTEHIGQDGKLYIRVRRAWGGQERQRYLRVNGAKSKIIQRAHKLDRQYAQAQQAYWLRRALPMNCALNDDGRIVGVNLQFVKRYGKEYPEFKIRIKNQGESKIHYSSVSVLEHGLRGAFIIAIEKVMHWRGIDRQAETAKKLVQAYSHYQVFYSTEIQKRLSNLPEQLAFRCTVNPSG